MKKVNVLKDFSVTRNPSAPMSKRVWSSYKKGAVAEVLESHFDALVEDGSVSAFEEPEQYRETESEPEPKRPRRAKRE